MSELKPHTYPREAMWWTGKGRDEEYTREIQRQRGEIAELVEALRECSEFAWAAFWGRKNCGSDYEPCPLSDADKIEALANRCDALIAKHS